MPFPGSAGSFSANQSRRPSSGGGWAPPVPQLHLQNQFLVWLSKAQVSMYPDSTGWQADAMSFISSTNTYLENKRQALGHMHFSFLPSYICLPNIGVICAHMLWLAYGVLDHPGHKSPSLLGRQLFSHQLNLTALIWNIYLGEFQKITGMRKLKKVNIIAILKRENHRPLSSTSLFQKMSGISQQPLSACKETHHN